MQTLVVDHPLVAHKLTMLREEGTQAPTFRRLSDELVTLLAYEAMREMRVRPVTVTTPLGPAGGVKLAGPVPLVVPVLRAGIGMLDGMTRLLPTADVGFVGMVRDEESLVASTYADRLPADLSGREVFVLDPMLATGGTLETVIVMLAERGAAAVTAVCLLAAPEGVARLEAAFPADDPVRVRVVAAALDERLNERGYIIPGLGDAGDRLCGRIGSRPRRPGGRGGPPPGELAYSGYVDGQAPDTDAGVAAQRLRQLRTSLALSQEQLAHRLGVSFATVNRWEAGRTRMSARALRALAEFEAQATASPPPGTLPVPHSSFVGREAELAELNAALRGRPRLISVTGPGGVGKTRLTLEAIRRFADLDQTAVIPLEPVRHPLSLTSAVASCLRLRDQPGVEVIASVEAALSATPRLVVIDGAEHLRDDVAALVSRLLVAVPELRIMVTSRTVLGVPGELCWPVPPMACPSSAAPVADIVASDAVRLFMARAEERLPGFATSDVAPRVIAELCRRLDCLPLAIELIAGWVGTLSLREIVEHGAALLAAEPDADGEQGGGALVDVVRRSYDLLRPEQQRLLPALSVFAGPFTVADAGAVGGRGGPSLARAIRGLVDSSWLLVDRGEPNRFSMLATMRLFAAARLDERDEGPSVRRRHAGHFAALAVGSEHGLAGPDAASWAARLEAAVADVDVALQWAAGGDIDLGLRMSAALWRWWLTSGQLAAGRGWLGRFLARAAQRRDEESGRVFCSAAVLAAENGDYPEAVRLAKIALGIFDALGLQERSAFAATVLGSAYRYLGDRDAAGRCFQAALDLRAKLDDRRGLSVALNNLALMALDEGDLALARENLEQSLVIKRQLGDQNSLAIGLANLSDVLIRSGELDAARRALAEAAELAEVLGNPQLIGLLEANRGFLAAEREQWAVSAGHFQAAALAHEEGGQAHDIVVALTGLGRAVHRLGRPDEAARHLRAAEALAAGIANPQRLADVRAALAEIGESADAAALPDGLTVRQVDVLRLLADGLSNKQIAAELSLSPVTIERHLATVYRKLGLGGRVEAARYAVTRGLAAPARML